jgi:Na+-transporting methylmalonyl-CoA/oxaloacetate decarboxylase gamma subunit
MNIDQVALTKALEITGIGLAGVFLFMAIFLVIIVGVDKLFPFKEEKEEE